MLRHHRKFVGFLVMTSYLLAIAAAWQHACHECETHTMRSMAPYGATPRAPVCSPHSYNAEQKAAPCTWCEPAASGRHQNPVHRQPGHDRQNCLLCRFNVQRSPTFIAQSLPDQPALVQVASAPNPVRTFVRPIFIPDCRAPPVFV